MAQSFSLTIQGNMAATFEDVKAKIARAGGKLIGNVKTGEVFGKTPLGDVGGTYAVEGNQVVVTITKKPWTIPASTVESKIREYFS